MTLSDQMDFYHVIAVLSDGTAIDGPGDIIAPELHDGELDSDDWKLLNGYSQQYGYRGPIMHPSETISGGLERDILAKPGYYVSLVNYSTDADLIDDDADSGWAIAFKEVD